MLMMMMMMPMMPMMPMTMMTTMMLPMPMMTSLVQVPVLLHLLLLLGHPRLPLLLLQGVSTLFICHISYHMIYHIISYHFIYHYQICRGLVDSSHLIKYHICREPVSHHISHYISYSHILILFTSPS